ncbi:MAG: glycolate oxidase subunit GlcE [Gammaproteobacteria bacterium]|nr:glycolate oxidase subunit GlcE [Gammaproteobacteria bacterium]
MTNIRQHDLEQAFQDRIRESVANAQALQIVGNGTKNFYGNASEGECLEVSAHSGVIDYDPAELVITLRGGCKLHEVEALLAEQGQMFGFEPPHFSSQASIGGMIASGLCGPRRAFAGGIRDYILGVKLLDGRGNVLNFGGRVIKNVAGFDVSRFMVGTMGTLGVLLEVSIRVMPKFEIEQTLILRHSSAEQHIQWVNELAGQPLPVSASVWHQQQSFIRLSGSEQGVSHAVKKIGGEKTADIWTTLREQSHAFFEGQSNVVRISLPPTTHFQLDQNQLIEWGGAQRWLVGDIDYATLRDRLQRFNGGLCIFRGTSESAFQPLDESMQALHRNLKSKFDPARIFNRGRLYLGL